MVHLVVEITRTLVAAGGGAIVVLVVLTATAAVSLPNASLLVIENVFEPIARSMFMLHVVAMLMATFSTPPIRMELFASLVPATVMLSAVVVAGKAGVTTGREGGL
jgi:hypothetical protein